MFASNVPGILFKIFLILLVFIIGVTIFLNLNPVIKVLAEDAYDEADAKKPEGLMKERSILGGLLAIAPIFYYGLSVRAVFVFLVYCVLALLAIIDMDTQYIPPELNVVLAGLGILSIWVLPGPTMIERIIGIVCVSLPLFLITVLVPGAFGGGDIKLMAAVGILLGWKGTVFGFFVGLVLGGVYAIFVLITRKLGRKDHFAFGPFLAIGIAVSLYANFGTWAIDKYLSCFRLTIR